MPSANTTKQNLQNNSFKYLLSNKNQSPKKQVKLLVVLILLQVFVVSTCSLMYELLVSTAISNVTGNSVTAFSLSIGLFLAGLGIGSYLSKFIKHQNLAISFAIIETLLAIIGGFSVILVYLAFGFSPYFRLVQVLLTLAIGLLSGFEIPILTRLLSSDSLNLGLLKNKLAEVMSFDYFGGLAASVLFPLLLLPLLGVVRLSFITGIINLSMAGLSVFIFSKLIKQKKLLIGIQLLAAFILLLATIFSTNIYNFTESRLYRDPIVYSQQSQYQRIVLTNKNARSRMYLNGNLQFSSLDEYRYHEALVMPAMLQLYGQSNLNIAVLGGGDGLVVTQLLKFSKIINNIKLIDIDEEVTKLAKQHTLITNVNQNSLTSSKVEVINKDAHTWLQEQSPASFNLIIADFPDPGDTSVAKLYSHEFFKLVNSRLSQNGVFATQSSGILFSPAVFWGIHKTMQFSFNGEGVVKPYTIYVPSFGQWGFNIFSKNNTRLRFMNENDTATNIPSNFFEEAGSLVFKNNKDVKAMFNLPKDALNPKTKQGNYINTRKLKVNTLDNLILVNYAQIEGIENFI